MSRKFRILALVLAALLTLSIFAGCDKKPVNDNSSVMTQSEVGGGDDKNTADDKQDGGDENTDGNNSETTSKTESKVSNNKKVTVNKTGWPITDKKVTFEIMGRTSANAADPKKMSMFSYMEKNTNVAIGSDAFFPFGDNIERAKKSGVTVIAQPGGSVRDDNVIAACDSYNMVMAFTGIRLFHH